MQNSLKSSSHNSASQEFDAELQLVAEYKQKIQNSASTLSKSYYQKKLNKQIKRVIHILSILEAGNPTIDAIQDKINE